MNPVLQQLESRLTEKLAELKQLESVSPQESSHFISLGDYAKAFDRVLNKFSNEYVSDKGSTNLNGNCLHIDWKEFESIEQMF